MKKINSLFLIVLVSIFCFSCKKDNTTYSIPTTYSFANVNYSDQTILIAMADQLVAQINTGNTIPNTVVSAQTLTAMFNNTGNPFNDSTYNLNGSGLSLANYFPAAEKTDVLNYFDSIALYSQSTTAASAGVAGVSPSSASPAKKYLLSPNGVFYSQVVKKAIMGAFSYQIANVYMADSINSTTDTAVLSHYWDAAFGFFGVPVNFPTSTTGLKYLGSYCNQVNPGLGSNTSIMNAFLKGRAAIVNKDYSTMKAQANLLISLFDKLDAAAIVQEMHETETNIATSGGPDVVAAYGTLSESLGFVRNLQYNTGKRVITSAQITALLKLYDNENPANPNMYNFVSLLLTQNATNSQTEAIAQYIGNIYGFSASELPLL